MLKPMIDFYNAHAYTHHYIFGVNVRGVVYAVRADADILPYVLTVEGRGAGRALRFKPNNDQRALLLALGAVAICSVDYLEAEFKASKYNRGDIFERLVTEYFGKTWVKDNIPFTDAGDVEADGVAYQVKYEKGTFITEGQIERMRADKAR